MGDGMDCLPGMRAVWRPSLPGRSTLTADAAERAALRALSKSEQRGEADRARAIPGLRRGRRCWARRGSDLRIPAPGQANKRAMLGAFDPVRPQLLGYASVTQRSTDFIALLDQLGAAYGTTEPTRPLVVVLDNRPIHTSKLTTKPLAQRPWLTLEWLPKYAPELNDIEPCWRDRKQHYLANRTFADADALDRAIPDALAPLNHQRQLKSSPIRRRAA